MRNLVFGILAFALIGYACTGSGSADPPDERVTTTAVDTASAAPTTSSSEAPSTTTTTIEEAGTVGIEERSIEVGGRSRAYLLFVPSTTGPSAPEPLVVNLAGAGDTAAIHVEYSNFNELAESEGIVVVYPDAIDQFWVMEDETDIEFIEAMIADVSALVSIDEARVYVTGMSQGGDFATLLFCMRPELFAAATSVAVLNHHGEPGICVSPQPARVLAIAGSADPGTTEGLPFEVPGVDLPGPLVDEEANWAMTNGCAAASEETELAAGVVRRDYQCADSAALAVIVHAGDHIWPQEDTDGLDANTIIWEFLRQYEGPLATG